MEKPIIVNSFSAGETSGYMSWYLNNFKKNKYDIVNIFMNTGLEHEETLIFADKCDKEFGMNLVWTEAIIDKRKSKGTRHKIVTFDTASREGEPFVEMVQKYGIPNPIWTHCTRELKQQVFKSYCRDVIGDNYETSIGIRADEIDRVSKDRKKNKIIYPLISLDVNKIDVNIFWRDMPFRLPIKGFEGNCATCFKKSLRKLLTIAKHNPERFEPFRKMEKLFPKYRFFRDNMSVNEIIELSKHPFEEATDDRIIYTQFKQTSLFGHDLDLSGACVESCEVF